MHKLLTLIMSSLCNQIFMSPIQWTATTNFPMTAIHIIDFSPGSTSCIGPLTACNLDGHGVHIIIVGDILWPSSCIAPSSVRLTHAPPHSRLAWRGGLRSAIPSSGNSFRSPAVTPYTAWLFSIARLTIVSYRPALDCVRLLFPGFAATHGRFYIYH